MNRSPRSALLLVLAAVSLLPACGDRKDTKTVDAAAAPASAASAAEHDEDLIKLSVEEVQRSGLQVSKIEPRPEAHVINVTATIRADQDRMARVAPRVEGRLTKVMAKLGDSVRSGQPLAVMDSVALGEAQSALRQAQTAQRLAQADLSRTQSLATDEIVPRRELVRAQAEAEKTTSELRAAQEKVRLLGASPSSGAGGGVSFEVRAPLSGVVIERKATVGELAGPAAPIFAIADLSVLWVEANLTEEALAKVRIGSAATVSVQAYPGEKFPGKVTYIASVIDRETRAIPARIEVPNADGRLKPEMFASATIETGGRGSPVITVPDSAIVLMQGQPTVFVQEGAGYEARAVELGDKLGGRTVVRSGLESGTQVVTAGAYALKARKLKSQIGDAH